MTSRPVRFLACIAILAAAGCHRMNVEQVTSKLRIGMTKAELDEVMRHEKFLKEQTVQARLGSTPEETRAAVLSNKTYRMIYPGALIRVQIPFDGTVKAYSYLIREERAFANPVYVDALVVFLDQKKDQVVGWADIRGLTEVRLWHDTF